MRLIDVDALNERISEIVKKQGGADIDLVPVSELPLFIYRQPTAYDVGKVVEQLEEFRPEMDKFGCDGILSDIIEVVKGGGVNE